MKALILLLLALSLPTWAQDALPRQYNIDCLDLTAGLPHNNVNHLFVDSQGFVWISTYGGGAVRYDGYTFRSPAIQAAGSSISNSCKGFAEDNHHRLWIAYDEGTLVLDLRTMSPVTPRYGQRDIGPQLRANSVRVYCDAKGHLWQVTRDSIYCYTFDDMGNVQNLSQCPYVGNTPDVNIRDIEQNGTVWINIAGGLYRLVDTGHQLQRRDIAPAMSQLQGHYVTDLLKRGNTVWIATNRGLYAYDLYHSLLRSYRHTTDPHSLSHDYATALTTLPDGQLLVGTLRGVNLLDEQSHTFQRWTATTPSIQTTPPRSPLPSDFVHCLLTHNGQLWIGTENAGIVRLSPQPLALRHYVHQPSHHGTLSPNPVNAMYAAADGTLWVGTVEGGLNRRNPDGTFTHWTTANSPLSHNSVSVLEPDPHGQLWVGTWGGGLNVVTTSSANGTVTLRHIDMPADMAAQVQHIGALAYDPYHDALWVGSNDGIFLYHPQTGRLEDPFPDNRLIRGCIGSIVDRDGQLWMGCLSGLCVIDLHSRHSDHQPFRYRHLSHRLSHPHTPVIDKISCFCQSADGTLWLGSNGYGLYRRTTDGKGHDTFQNLTTDHGLANNAVKGIVEDVQGRLWITTDNGLSVLDPRTQTFSNYTEHDGLLCQRFYWNSAIKGPDETIYLGSAAGLTQIRSQNASTQPPLHLTFTRLQVDNQEITAASSHILDADISQATRIRLHESCKSFAIDFSTLTYTGQTQGHYSYRLQPFEDEWIPLKPGDHAVRYTSPKPGHYTFQVKYVTADATQQQTISMQLEVAPYFWKSWWFLLLMMAALAGITVWIYQRRMEDMRRQEAEKLLLPIRNVLAESEAPEQLQSRIQNILDNHERLKKSYHRSVEADKEESRRTNKSFMERATEIMEQNYMNSEFGITEFAEAIGMSKSLVSKRLNEETGQSTGQFIRNYRLNIAKKLLMENVANRNITEIAYKVGFNDPKYFTRCFTRQYGNSPSNYIEEDSEVDKI